jgi:hypothetical protein
MFLVASSVQGHIALTLIFWVGIRFALCGYKLMQPHDEHKRLTERNKHMLRNISTTFGSAMAALCLVSTLAMAQPQNTTVDSTRNPRATASEYRSQDPSQRQSQPMTCIKDDGMGNCTAAVGDDGKNMVVVGQGLKTGDAMTCVDMKSVLNCKPAS